MADKGSAAITLNHSHDTSTNVFLLQHCNTALLKMDNAKFEYTIYLVETLYNRNICLLVQYLNG